MASLVSSTFHMKRQFQFASRPSHFCCLQNQTRNLRQEVGAWKEYFCDHLINKKKISSYCTCMLQKISDHVVITYALKAKAKHAKDNCLARLKPREEQCWDVMRPRIIISIKFSRKLIAEMSQSSQISALFAQQLIFYTFETAILIFTNQPTRSNWNKSMHRLFVDKCKIDTFAKDLMESGVNRTLNVASSRVIWAG